MKQDNLEKFIENTRAEFDTEVVPPMVWMQVQNSLDPDRSKITPMWRKFVGIAAAMIVVLTAGVVTGIQLGNGANQYSEEFVEFENAEHYYQKEVSFMLSQIGEEGEEVQSLKQDLNQLDQIYNELKTELLSNPGVNTEEVIAAMLENYRAKIDILETVMSKYKSNQSNDKINMDYETIEI